MEQLEEVVIFINGVKFLEKMVFLSKNLESLRKELENEIPNNIYFIKEGKFIIKEIEKSLLIKDITKENNCIHLIQEYIYVFIDGKKVKKNIDIFMKDPFKKYIKNYSKELPKTFIVKSKSNVFIEMDKSLIDDDIIIEDILIGNSLYIFSLANAKIEETKIISQNGFLGFFVKKNGNIIFNNIDFKNIRILDSLMLDGKFENKLNEPDYEIRRRKSFEEYEQYKKDLLNEEKLKEIISNNNTNEIAIYDYLLILKRNKNPKFQEELKKYAYFLNIEKLKSLDNKFNNDKFKEYKDEKTNLTNYLKKVIKGYYDNYNDVNLIICDIDYRNNINNDIISPFIGGFNKDIYINIPISISDNNLFFHYLRVKFFQCLQFAFGDFKNEFVYFCEILVNKIYSLPNQKTLYSQKRLLLEIFCMICIFGLHDEYNGTEIINYYNYDQKISNLYYHPIIFFSIIKNVFIDYIRMIGNSICLNTALINYKNIINKDAEKPA